jgi:hypothetical protein
VFHCRRAIPRSVFTADRAGAPIVHYRGFRRGSPVAQLLHFWYRGVVPLPGLVPKGLFVEDRLRRRQTPRGRHGHPGVYAGKARRMPGPDHPRMRKPGAESCTCVPREARTTNSAIDACRGATVGDARVLDESARQWQAHACRLDASTNSWKCPSRSRFCCLRASARPASA